MILDRIHRWRFYAVYTTQQRPSDNANCLYTDTPHAKKSKVMRTMSTTKLLLTIQFIAVVSAQTFFPSRTLVRVSTGALRGRLVTTSRFNRGVAFLNVPFVDAPIGDRRFARLRPVTPWTGVRNATAYGVACMQNNAASTFTAGEMGEDCVAVSDWRVIYVHFTNS